MEKYPFAQVLGALEEPKENDASDTPLAALAQDHSVGEKAPRGTSPAPDAPLSPTAKDAVAVGRPWQDGRNTPTEGRDGRVTYEYGAGLPEVVCAPLRICVIELQLGEKLIGEPHIGDAVRWNISPAIAGRGELTTAMVVIKPKQPGLDTNLLVTTDRRAYYVRLLSKQDQYTARIAFHYPDETEVRWQEYLSRRHAERQQESEAAMITPLTPGGVDKLYFEYAVRGGDENMRPVRVMDDGVKTYIQMSPNVRHREAPVLVVVDADNKAELVNYRVQGDFYVVDRLFERAALILGAGKKARKAEILRGTYDRSKRGKRDPYEKFTRG